MTHKFTKLEEPWGIPHYNCNFCKGGNNTPKVMYRHMGTILHGQPVIQHYHWFCDDTCANCYILSGKCK